MSDDTIAAAFRFMAGSPTLVDELTAVWHAGEPLVLGPEYFRNAFQIAARILPPRVRLRHAIQTNGMLLDEEWCALFRDHGVSVGVSLDGPANLHDARRRTRGGTGTHAAVMRGVEILQQQKIPFHVIAVLSRASLAIPDAIFDFFVATGVRELGFNIEELEGHNAESTLRFTGVEDEYRSFLRHFLMRLRDAAWPLALREYDGACVSVLKGTRADNPQVVPWRMISVGVEGDLATFSPELLGQRTSDGVPFNLGNVHTHSFEIVSRSLRLLALRSEIERGVQACGKTCSYFEFCGGGAPANKLAELGCLAGTETLYCRLTQKATIDTILDFLEEADTVPLARGSA
jgi:uncharacterized protein